MSQVDIANDTAFFEDCAALVGLISRLTLASESKSSKAEDGPANYEWLVNNYETLEDLIRQARKLVP
jgi:hypothetical protein